MYLSYLPLWILGMVGALSLIAAALGHAGRLKTRSHQTTGPFIVIGLLFGLVLLAIGGALYYFFRSGRPFLTLYSLSWGLVFGLGTLLLVRNGWRGVGDEPPGPSCRTWPTARLSIIAAGAAVFQFGLLVGMDLWQRSELADLVARSDEIVSRHRPHASSSEDAAPFYRRAFLELGPPSSWPPWLENVLEPDFDPREERVEELLKRTGRCTALLYSAAARPHCALGVDYRIVTQAQFYPELHWFRQAHLLLALQARFSAVHGETRAAVKALGAMEAMVRHVAEEPLIISLLFAGSLAEDRVRALETTLTVLPSAGLLAAAAQPQFSFWSRLATCLSVDEALTLDGLVRQETSDNWAARMFFLPFEIPALQFGFKELHALEKRGAVEYREALIECAREFRRSGIVGRVYFPALAEVPIFAARADAWMALGRAALLVSAERERLGRYPSSRKELEQSRASLPADPFDGRPLKIVRRPDELLLYSVGEDGQDDGGRAVAEAGGVGDLVLSLTVR